MKDQSVAALKNPMNRLFKYLKKYQSNVLFSVSSSIIHKAFDLMPPILTAWMIDTVSGQAPTWLKEYLGIGELWPGVVFLAILTFVIFGFESFTEWLYKLGFMRLAQRVQHDLRMEAYDKMQQREIAYFENQRTGNLMAILNDDINQLERFLNNSFNDIIQLTALVIMARSAIIVVDPTLGLISMAPIPFIILGSFYYQKKVAPHYRQIRENVGKLGTRLENNISGMMVIKSFTAEKYEQKRVQDVSLQYRDSNFNAIRLSASYVPLIRMIIAVGFAIVLLLACGKVMQGDPNFTVGSLAFFAMMIQRLLWPITRLGVVFDEYERARASSRRVFTLIDAQTKIKNSNQAIQLSLVKGNIDLNQIGFYYKKEVPILQQLNLKILAGQTIGIAGPTGAGKTTLIKLLLRLYDVTSGSIKIDGVDIRDIQLTALRKNIALVSQEVYLFHGSIQDNIAYGQDNASFAQIKAAAIKAQLHDFIISLPNAYETIVGERGIKLSGGQRQRLSISRAILKNAPILILDEATSAVDTETERAIQENLNQLTVGKTAIIIAHRLSTIRRADKIIVLENGRLTESGTHQELIEQKGIYADLWNVQTGVLIE